MHRQHTWVTQAESSCMELISIDSSFCKALKTYLLVNWVHHVWQQWQSSIWFGLTRKHVKPRQAVLSPHTWWQNVCPACVRSSVVAVESASLAHLFGNKVLQPSEESHLCLHQAAWLQMWGVASGQPPKSCWQSSSWRGARYPSKPCWYVGKKCWFVQDTIPCLSVRQRSLTFLRVASNSKPGCQHFVCVKCHRGWSRV